MCIRDRPQLAAEVGGEGRERRAGDGEGRQLIPFEPEGFKGTDAPAASPHIVQQGIGRRGGVRGERARQPVSYTHLAMQAAGAGLSELPRPGVEAEFAPRPQPAARYDALYLRFLADHEAMAALYDSGAL